MGNRIPWDKSEAAILLEKYLEVKAGQLTKKEAATRVSEMLRRKAEINGIEIDDTFRNINGITMQFGNLEYILSSGQHGLESSSRLFMEIVDLYQTNEKEFNLLLRGMKCQMEDDMKENDIDVSDIFNVIKKHFEYGMRVSSPIEIMRFRRFYLADFGTECQVEDEKLADIIKDCGFLYHEKVYLLSESTIENVKLLVSEYKENKLNLLYFEKFFNENEESLTTGGIFSFEMLKEIIVNYANINYVRNNFCLLQEENMTEAEALEKDILLVWGEECLQNYNDLQSKLKYIPIEKIKYGVASRSCFVWDSSETYTTVFKLKITEEQKEYIYKSVISVCKESGYCCLDDVAMDDVLAENYEFNVLTVYALVFEVLLSKEFNRNSKVVYSEKIEGSPAERLQKYCEGKKQCSLQELLDQYELFTGHRRQEQTLDIGNAAMIRVDEELFVSDENVVFDVEVIDSLLINIIKNDFIAMKEVISFSLFPFFGYSWNYFVLESYCRRFSKKFKYMALTANSKNAGAIVKKECNLDFHHIMAKSVAESEIELTNKNVLEYLVRIGFLSRCQYKQIDDLILVALEIREGRI